jgi:hypothetical protein
VNEVLAGRDGHTAAVTDPAQYRQQVTGGRAGCKVECRQYPSPPAVSVKVSIP